MTRSPLTFRVATADDIRKIAELSYHSFPMASMPVEAREKRFSEDPRIRVENYVVGEADGCVVASTHWIPFTTWIGGVGQPMQGVASVVVAHEARRRGYASDLMVEVMRRARERGTALSALYPFRHSFYASLGYATSVEHRVWTFPPNDLPHYAERASVRRATAADLDRINACYERVMRRSTLMVERGPADWDRRHFEQGRAYAEVFDDGAAVRGYFIFRYRERDGHHTQLFVQEIVYEDQEALRGLLGHIAALRDQFMEVVCVTRAGERLELRLANPRDGGAIKGMISDFVGPRVLWGAMARILDVERAFAARPSYNGATGRLSVEIDDRQLPENRGPWTVSFEDGRATVARSEAGTARASIATLTQLYLGFVSASEARDLGLLTADDPDVALLDRAFAGPRPSLMDQF